MGHTFPGQPLQLLVLMACSQHQPVYSMADGGRCIGCKKGGTADLGGGQAFDLQGIVSYRGPRLRLYLNRLRIAVFHGAPVQRLACRGISQLLGQPLQRGCCRQYHGQRNGKPLRRFDIRFLGIGKRCSLPPHMCIGGLGPAGDGRGAVPVKVEMLLVGFQPAYRSDGQHGQPPFGKAGFTPIIASCTRTGMVMRPYPPGSFRRENCLFAYDRIRA